MPVSTLSDFSVPSVRDVARKVFFVIFSVVTVQGLVNAF